MGDIKKTIPRRRSPLFSVQRTPVPETVFQYADDLPREEENITDTLHYSKNENIVNYSNLDFRLSGNMQELSDEFLCESQLYTKLHRYMFLLTNTISISPTDRWKLADSYIKPMSGGQYSAGIYRNFLGNSIETSVEVYYKEINNLVEYEDGADFLKTEIPEAEVIQGDLEAYGIELMIKKPQGVISGWVNYTYSSSTVTAIDKRTGESNNLGMPDPR
ncbi:MAG: hypothetical protein U5L09_21005 [Bacteroidales bacterium]|nr:hypothetical protein [Bacteroidales bacterium]